MIRLATPCHLIFTTREGTYSLCVSSEVDTKVQHERVGILKYAKAVARRKPYFSEHDYSVSVLLNDVIVWQRINNASFSRCTVRGGRKRQTNGT